MLNRLKQTEGQIKWRHMWPFRCFKLIQLNTISKIYIYKKNNKSDKSFCLLVCGDT